MKTKFLLFVLLTALSQSVFSQNNSTEKNPQAYLFSGGENRQVERKKAYLSSGGDVGSALTRPRRHTSAESPVNKSNAKTSYSLERRAFELINRQRETSGLSPLSWCNDAARIARLHSENMANYNFFSHAGLDGLMVNDRADLLGIRKWQAIGENIAYNQGFENPVEFAVERWMQSPKHRDNLLNARWKESGIGVAVTDDGKYYFTEVFLARK